MNMNEKPSESGVKSGDRFVIQEPTNETNKATLRPAEPHEIPDFVSRQDGVLTDTNAIKNPQEREELGLPPIPKN